MEEKSENGRPKLLVIGHAEHGKDTVCEMLRDRHGLTFASSSLFVAEHVMLPAFEKVGHPYASAEECYADRRNHRAFWHETIRMFNHPNPARLAWMILKEHDVYCGMRHPEEFVACIKQRLFDAVIWVDGSHRKPPEPATSMGLTIKMADYYVDNNGSLSETEDSVDRVMFKVRHGQHEHKYSKGGLDAYFE
jgi:hypothetical protein